MKSSIILSLHCSLLRHPNGELNKRGLDLGLGRGFSGSQAAKHLMGLAAANYAGGPGRRRRAVGSQPQLSFERSSKVGGMTSQGAGQLEKAFR
ncbi:UNVERIFIED_CONTAM: hypothetical protein GTU68_036367 [Idotea baltica]|nr:hypothetical protein [Idotea baltica]